VTIDDRHNIDALERRLREFADVEIIDEQAIVAIVGRRLLADSLVASRIFEALRGIPTKMISLGRSGLNLSIVIDDRDSERAIQRIHAALFEQDPVGAQAPSPVQDRQAGAPVAPPDSPGGHS